MHSTGKSFQFPTSNKAAPWLGWAKMIRFICILIKKKKVCQNARASATKQTKKANMLDFAKGLPNSFKSYFTQIRLERIGYFCKSS